jgi:hypothetical protein
MYMCSSAYHFIIVLSLLLPWIVILFLHLLSIIHKCTQSCYFFCYSNLLLRRRGWTVILRQGVLGYMLPRLSFLWCYGVFHCSVPLRVIIVFRNTIYVIIIILYSWQLVICEHFWPYVWNNWSWIMYMMSTWFWYKNRVWHAIFGVTTAALGQLLQCLLDSEVHRWRRAVQSAREQSTSRGVMGNGEEKGFFASSMAAANGIRAMG